MLNKIKNKIGPVVLLVIDGWGVTAASDGNAISRAQTPIFKELVNKYPATILATTSARAGNKKINIADGYLELGTGKIKYSKNNLSIFDYLEQSGLKYFVISEPEKLAYATFFANNKKKIKATNFSVLSEVYDDSYLEKPGMANKKMNSELLKKIKSGKVDFLMVVMANLDLLAHSGNFSATLTAVEMIDRELNAIVKTVLDNSGVLLITSTHGNAEESIEMQTELTNKKDTSNPVPFIIIGKQFEGKSFGFTEAPGGDLALVPPSGSLLDVTPTILKIIGLEQSKNLEGKSLI
jgi:2,3-bisphosphoglycerate-independent phosphoglycerate mutase